MLADTKGIKYWSFKLLAFNLVQIDVSSNMDLLRVAEYQEYFSIATELIPISPEYRNN